MINEKKRFGETRTRLPMRANASAMPRSFARCMYARIPDSLGHGWDWQNCFIVIHCSWSLFIFSVVSWDILYSPDWLMVVLGGFCFNP